MATVKISKWAYVYAESVGLRKPSVILLDDPESSDDKWALLNEIEITVNVPEDFDPRPEQIRGLREQLANVRANAEKKCTEITRQINELLAIENHAN